jgi:hypothetical protein
MQELRWYDRTETFTRPGLAFIMVVLRDSTPPADVPEEFYQARKKLGDETAHLPRGVIGPMVNYEYSDVTFALYALKAKGEPHSRLVREAEALRQRLLHVPGVKKVNIIALRGDGGIPDGLQIVDRAVQPDEDLRPLGLDRACGRHDVSAERGEEVSRGHAQSREAVGGVLDEDPFRLLAAHE